MRPRLYLHTLADVKKKNIKYAHLCMRDNGDGGTFVSRAAFLQRQELTY